MTVSVPYEATGRVKGRQFANINPLMADVGGLVVTISSFPTTDQRHTIFEIRCLNKDISKTVGRCNMAADGIEAKAQTRRTQTEADLRKRLYCVRMQ
jgi:hypothetical protein